MAERQDDLRAADADRAKVADRLRVALDEGRLTLDEYDERLQKAYAAKTYGELDPLLTDLPQVAPAGASQVVRRPAATAGPALVQAPVAGPVEIRRWLAGVWGAWLFAVLINVVIWVAVSAGTGDVIYPWPIWVAGPWGVVLLAITVSGLVSGAPRRAGERHARREARRRTRRGH